jgi:hypothetical protein
VPTSPTFKYRGPDKRCPFPFNRDAATSPGSGYDYVTLTETAGDEGLAEACRLWWLLEEVVFTPSGSVSGSFGLEITFSGSSTLTYSVEPVDRVANASNSIFHGYDNTFYVSYVSSEWRLYYRFIFVESLGDADIVILNPANTYGTTVTSGTFSLFGYTLDWELASSFSDGSASGAGLTATSTFYTLE